MKPASIVAAPAKGSDRVAVTLGHPDLLKPSCGRPETPGHPDREDNHDAGGDDHCGERLRDARLDNPVLRSSNG